MVDPAAVPRLEVVNVSVRFDGTAAVDDVSLSVGAGESVAVVGPSGCGKSTLLRAIAGLQELDEGRVCVDGTDITSVPTHRRGIGLMFQDHALFEHQSAADNIEFGLAMQNVERTTRVKRVNELLKLVDLDGFGDRAIPTLSGGEAQRVALARSLAPAPTILLLDEPLGALDQHHRDNLVIDLRNVLRSVAQTVLYVTHDLAEAAVIGDRIAIMNNGGLARLDTPVALWNDPQTGFVARFIGLNVVDFEDELVALAAHEITIADGSASGGSTVTVIGSWFQDGAWTVLARSGAGRELRWTSPHSLHPDTVVTICPVRDAPKRPIAAST